MGFQFLHVESYARQAGKGKAGGHTVASVMAEATRQPDACPHVENPAPPILLFGCSLAEVESKANEWAASSTDAIGRKLRKDGLCLLAGVISAPDDMAAEVWESMKQEAIAWLNQDGRLVSVAEHADEAHRHVHFYKIPAPGARFETLHPSRAAALEAKADGALRGEQNRAYKEAMRGFQDDFFEQVGARHGLTRLGPAKRRLTRSEWKNEQVAALSLANAMAKAEQMLAIAASASTSAADAQATADKAKADAANSHKAALDFAEKIKADADKVENARKANSLVVAKWMKQKASMDVVAKRISEDRAVVEKWGQRAGLLGAFVGRAVDAFKGILTKRAATESARAAALALAQKTAAAAKLAASEERAAANRSKLARDAAVETARKQMREIEAERDKALQEVARLRPQGPKQGPIGPTMRR